MSKPIVRFTVGVVFCVLTLTTTGFADTKLQIKKKSFGEYAPKELVGAAADIDTKRDRMIVFGRENGEDVVLLALDLDSEAWTRLKTTVPEPEGSGKPGMVYVASEDAIYLFGGWAPGEQQPKSEFWRLDLSKSVPLEWELVKPEGPTPPARNGMVFVCDVPRGRLLLHGGDGGPHPKYGYTPLDDFWSYDLSKKKWEQLKPTGDAPTPRWNHAGAIDAAGAKLYVFGGGGYVIEDEPRVVLDTSVYTLDLATMVWTKSPEMKRAPRPVQGTSFTFDAKAGALVLVGGMVMDTKGEPGVERIYSFDIAGAKWTRTKEILSEKRRDHVGVYDAKRNRHIIYGGQTVTSSNYYRPGDSLGDSLVVMVRRSKSE